MKLHLKGISSSLFLFALTSQAFADQAVFKDLPPTTIVPAKFYIGVFGGSGRSNDLDVSQFGTAFYTEADGGPLAVNAFGQLDNHSAPYWGGQLGYQAQGILLTPSAQWTLGPAAELETFYIRSSSFSGDLNNNTDRLDEHDFVVTYPMSRTVFLANAIISFNNPNLPVHPYIGFGIGGAIVKITDADATQVAPPEAGVNHYNSDTSDTDTAFAGQIKVGISYDIIKNVSIFADYRWLYLSGTDFVFGSTVYPAHPATSNWQVKLDSQQYNLGNVGIRFNIV